MAREMPLVGVNDHVQERRLARNDGFRVIDPGRHEKDFSRPKVEGLPGKTKPGRGSVLQKQFGAKVKVPLGGSRHQVVGLRKPDHSPRSG